MDINFAHTLQAVKLSIMDTAQKANIRRLNVLRDESSCRAGCSACCSRMVHITVAEAIILREHLLSTNEWADVRVLATEQTAISRNVHPLAWLEMNIPCPILNRDTKMCRAYPVRPPVCSTHFVTSKPELCDPWSTEDGEFKLADQTDLVEKFDKSLEREIDSFGILAIKLPIPVCLLVAEKLQYHKDLSVSDAMVLIYNELSK